MLLLHTYKQLCIGYKDQALKSKEKQFTVRFICPLFPKSTFYVQFLTVPTLVIAQGLTIPSRAEKFISFLAPSIICSTKEKNRKSDKGEGT
jgi:hypothetical protein